MKNIKIKDIETDRLLIKVPTMSEQKSLWNIIKLEEVNRYYFPTPNRIFDKYNLSKENISDLIQARMIFQKQLNDWERQKPFYKEKIRSIKNGDNSQKFTWSVFLKSGEVIGQMTVQPNEKYLDNPVIRDVGWFISPKYQGQGYAYETAKAILDFMFLEVKIEKIITSAAVINTSSWKLMEKLGFERIGEKKSTYLDENNQIVNCFCYEVSCDKYLKKRNYSG